MLISVSCVLTWVCWLSHSCGDRCNQCDNQKQPGGTYEWFFTVLGVGGRKEQINPGLLTVWVQTTHNDPCCKSESCRTHHKCWWMGQLPSRQRLSESNWYFNLSVPLSGSHNWRKLRITVLTTSEKAWQQYKCISRKEKQHSVLRWGSCSLSSASWISWPVH